MVKVIVKKLLKYPIKLANRLFVYNYYKTSPKRDNYRVDNIIAPSDRLLVISPHVDDETIGLGASLIKAKELGLHMSLVYMTDGGGSTSDLSREELVAERKKEGLGVKESYGFNKVYFLDEPDGNLNSSKPSLVDRLVDILEREMPSKVFTPFLIDGHRDHVETSLALMRAVERWDEDFKEIYMYEVNCPIYPELITDLTTMDEELFLEKGQKYQIFKSQWVMGFDAFKLLDRGKAKLLEGNDGAQAAEVFVKADLTSLKSIEEYLKSIDFKPHAFRQLSSEYNLILAFLKNRGRKDEIMRSVKEILRESKSVKI